MKRLLFALLAIPLLFASCGDDDLPNVKFTVNYDGGIGADGVIYVVQGDELAITGLYVTPYDTRHSAAIAEAVYYWDGIPAGATVVVPFGRAFDTAMYSVGDHFIQIRCNLVETDCAPAVGVVTLPVRIVASADEIPSTGEGSGTVVPDVTIED